VAQIVGEELDAGEILFRCLPPPGRSPIVIERLVVVLGDQLTLANPALAGVDRRRAVVVMAEVRAESTHVWSSKPRTALFFAAMRHHAALLAKDGWHVEYLRIGAHAHADLPAVWRDAIARHGPREVRCCETGDHRVERALVDVCASAGVPLRLLDDDHFLVSRADFARWAGGARTMRMESFYREVRRRHGILLENGQPVGGQWNFDAENRASFGRHGPGDVPAPPACVPDGITRDALRDVEAHFGNHPGSLARFAWPVTRVQALDALAHFVRDRLPRFGETQDAMWSDQPFLFHSLLSASLNLKLLSPREVVDAALAALHRGHAPLAAVEGFVRQIVGWREFVRGVYWLDMPGLAAANHYGHVRPLPGWFWTGDTGMHCQRQAIRQTLDHGYAHHIQRLMITGNFALLAGIAPRAVSDWYLAVYVDAVEWVELPNTAGMALYATGARFTTKPYAASGAYVKRMSNYCGGCRYRPDLKTGPGACPITALYWNFLLEHEAELENNPRTTLMTRHLRRLSAEERVAIASHARTLADRLDDL
jgi:deoxyribodipyrimidine photolyase-related protein